MKFPPSFPQLTTFRMVLRALQASDAPAVWELLRNPAAVQYYDIGIANEEKAVAYIRLLDYRFGKGENLMWGVALWDDPAHLIGMVGLEQDPDHHSTALVRYILHPSYWQQGLMREALVAVIQFGFARLPITCLTSLLHPENKKAQQLLTTFGFSHMLNRKIQWLMRDRYVNLEVWQLEKSQYQKAQSESDG
jgi:ribosomal-protein-alanine N-acetyltransferase